ncbi:MAG: D-glycero-beta-D-manno-heptose 1-phosphate adenylyltransferase [Candidatus Omnitrophica bacterium]|nr:D-glycero-beta-D-manno-heptose 1-phosphate adenylyltransferase [Candidatus Omnitrophota bacterium]
MIVTQKKLKNIVATLRRENKKIVFTNGCFDIIHPGHIRSLEEAKRYADILIVGINSDSSIKRIKDDSRPIFNQNERAEILSSLRVVDYVVIFYENTPRDLIKMIRPDFLAKGGDWSIDKIVGGEFVNSYGGKVISLPYLKGYSTTGILNRINK